MIGCTFLPMRFLLTFSTVPRFFIITSERKEERLKLHFRINIIALTIMGGLVPYILKLPIAFFFSYSKFQFDKKKTFVLYGQKNGNNYVF